MKPPGAIDLKHRAFEDEQGAELADTLRAIVTKLAHLHSRTEHFACRLHDANGAPVGTARVKL